jgi:hypothetical protein
MRKGKIPHPKLGEEPQNCLISLAPVSSVHARGSPDNELPRE